MPVTPNPIATIFFDQFSYGVSFSFHIAANRHEFLKMLTVQLQRVRPIIRELIEATRTFHGNLLLWWLKGMLGDKHLDQ
jgi:hypothetical protein